MKKIKVYKFTTPDILLTSHHSSRSSSQVPHTRKLNGIKYIYLIDPSISNNNIFEHHMYVHKLSMESQVVLPIALFVALQ